MKKLTILIALLVLALCILPCYAEQAPTSAAPTVDGASDAGVDAVDSDSAEQQPSEDHGFIFTPANFIDSLSYMGTGMIGIFLVIGLIVLSTVLLNRLFRGKSDEQA